jgi:5-methylcytosine-specific restriction endonuclease McrA
MARPCLECGAVTTKGARCPECYRRRERTRKRPAYRQAYSDPRYREARDRLRGQPCHWCGKPGNTVDHLMPISRGGTNDPSNLVSACAHCNEARGNRPGPPGRG